jgi:type II secretory ATPase GspE/PulE/Tfp pilus assembly ATPase PilB-like protein
MPLRAGDQAHDRRLIGDLLIESGLLSRDGLRAALQEQRLRGGRLGYNLLRLGRVTPASFYLFLLDHLRLLTPDLSGAMQAAPAIDLLPARIAHHYGIVPVRAEDGVLDLAIATADHPALIAAVRELTGLRVEPLVCPPALIAAALERFYPSEVEAGVLHRAAGDNLLVVAEQERGLRPLLPEAVRHDAPAAEWLRSICAEAIRRGARRIRVEPEAHELQVLFEGRSTPQGTGSGPPGSVGRLHLPLGIYAGLARLIEGLTRIAARGRVVPREGRFLLLIDGRRLRVSVLALPGLPGESYTLDLRQERVEMPAARAVLEEMPGLEPALARMAEQRRGLLVLAGPGSLEAGVGLEVILDLLADRLPRRIAVAEWGAARGVPGVGGDRDEERVPLRALINRAVSEDPDLLVLPDLARNDGAAAAAIQARERVVVAAAPAVDAFDAADRLTRAGVGASILAGGAETGLLGIRLMETLCQACRRPYDLHGLLSPGPAQRCPAPGTYHLSQGCTACRGSGVASLVPAFEFIGSDGGETLFRPGLSPSTLRERHDRGGRMTLYQAAVHKAAAGLVDVREPLRFLLHEQH